MKMRTKKLEPQVLFPRVLLLREGKALGLFPASCAFLSVVSAFAVSHKS